MTPWPTPPQSIAHGILDDETYDWFAIVEGMLDSGGYPVVVDEDTLSRAARLAGPVAGMEVSATGAAGLAGLMHTIETVGMAPDEHAAVVLTGRER